MRMGTGCGAMEENGVIQVGIQVRGGLGLGSFCMEKNNLVIKCYP